jgi:hypothetical protein
MATQAPIKVNEATKEKIRYLAAFCDLSQAGLVEKAVDEFAARHAEELRAAIDRARTALSGGDAEVAAYLLDEHPDAVRRVAGAADQTSLRPSMTTSAHRTSPLGQSPRTSHNAGSSSS